MYELNNECDQRPLSESWEALDSYFACISECSMNDRTCVSRCLDQHLNIDDGLNPSLASFVTGPATRKALFD